ncbi:hypothetical protein ABL78_2275 [Leptomonas seymouri]|uniref:Sedlin n=1 Tax=Leptomonas seymouri TaxID=5684 RepID=A0A0N0P7P7_LEPSE|nr:hypothetical protein ABL78_2275 [Leptomonas seymouri]|eukprot:KPI88607.1 hypothetical protein ABL78_2275 [Leptomonas seymouri]
MSLETWAVAAVAIIDVEGSPLLLRTYTSPKAVLNSPAAPLHAHLYVGPEDVIKLHFVLFASLDRCDELHEAAAERMGVSPTDVATSPLSAMSQRRPPLTSAAVSAPRGNSVVSGVSTAPRSSILVTSSDDANPSNPSITAAAKMIANDSLPASSAANAARLISPTTDARFLGKLLESYRMRSYGFCSATGIRTLLVTVGSDAPADAMVPLCRTLYESASAALCNPFRSPLQSYHAQEQLLFMSSLMERSDRSDENTLTSPPLAPASSWMANMSLKAEGINPLHLPDGAVEWSWPRAAPASVASLTAEPTLALSRTFNTQMESLLSTFTVTARSCIVR